MAAPKFPLMRNNIAREDLDAVIRHLQQDDPILTNGPNCAAFESEWSEWLGVKHSVFVNSGASANMLSMAILKIRHPEGGEVIVPPLTWISDVATVLQNGFTPVFADIDRRTLGMDTDAILAAITPNTRAVFLTHAQGFDALSDRLLAELAARDIPLIEDVCESHGATHDRRRLGSLGWMSNFSFYYAHHLSTIEGGMVCTDDPKVYQQLRMLRSHGMVRELNDADLKATYIATHPELNPDFIFAYPAFNMRNNEIGGIMGRSQLKRLDANVARRTQNLHRFLAGIDGRRYQTDFAVEGSSNYAFNLIMNEADPEFVGRLMATMREAGIEFRRGSAGGGNQVRQPYLRGIVPADHHLAFPVCEHVHFYGFYLGNFPDLRDDEIDVICRVVNQAWNPMTTAIVLAGGLGTRLRSAVPDLPKPMAPVAGRPFLAHLMDHWMGQGVQRFILSVGYRHEAILAHFGTAYRGAAIDYAVETTPLGTGGGVRQAARFLEPGEPALVLNGDTWFGVDLAALRDFAIRRDADWCLALFPATEAGRYMGLKLDDDGRIQAMRHDDQRPGRPANGGVYWVHPRVWASLPVDTGPFSLEDSWLASALAAGQRLFGLPCVAPFIDIGVPHDYHRAADVLPTPQLCGATA